MAVDEVALQNALFQLEDEVYMVDNSELKSKSSGIKFRVAPSLKELDSRTAKFGDLVEGVSFPEGWLMVDGFGRRR
eukprot:CAMPEP_0168392890 /NCGR_PEP_ID=MMETSP0228-20121227/18730_1 /TAXON_ID=133427 /ORGANISM="Protoceratium reticulatum, Strain CCCM 535 (=CCMP 1889)" /LENGTH=75 /DNA_ID=CAMNT_0008406243 /DNA_START=47 /DNA_END=271 /DNA_ORIENTATION=-